MTKRGILVKADATFNKHEAMLTPLTITLRTLRVDRCGATFATFGLLEGIVGETGVAPAKEAPVRVRWTAKGESQATKLERDGTLYSLLRSRHYSMTALTVFY